MKICLNNVSKRYRNHWIFKQVSCTFESGKQYAILGANGSGKSTLLRIVGGIQSASAGNITYTNQDKNISVEKLYTLVSFCAPAMELIEEMTLTEFLHFHFSHKKLLAGYSISRIIEEMQLTHAAHKFIQEFSSGMKQRVKLAQAFFADTPILLLDEPCSNLDTAGVDLYTNWLTQLTTHRLVIIASNDEREYLGASTTISIETYKPNA